MGIVQVDKLRRILSSSQRSSYGLKRCCFTRTPVGKSHINCLTSEEKTRQPYRHNMCLFCAFAVQLHGNQQLEETTSESFNLFMNKMDGPSASQFQRVHLNDIPIIGDLLLLRFLLYDIDFVEANIIGELSRRSVQKHENNVGILSYNIHVCYMINNSAVFQSIRCPNCDTFSNKTPILEQKLSTCSERVKNVGPTNV